MKKLCFVLALAFGVCLSVAAQEVKKDVVLVDFFQGASGIDEGLVENLRARVIQGISETGRVQIVDAATQSSIDAEQLRRKSEAAMYDENVRNSVMQTLGAKYIIAGEVTTISATKRVSDEGKVSYVGNLTWTIKVLDPSNGTIKYTKAFTYGGGGILITSGIGNTEEEAILKTCDKVKAAMDNVVDEAFPIEGLLLKIESVKKNKAESVYIDLGSLRGISVNQRFEVYMEVDIAGELSRKEIGELNAKEVLSGNRTLCKVTKGGDEIYDAMNKGQKVVVVSRASKLFEF